MKITAKKLEAIRILITEHPLGFNIKKLLRDTRRYHPLHRNTMDKFLRKQAVHGFSERKVVALFECKFGELTDDVVDSILKYRTVLASILLGGVCENCHNYWSEKCNGKGGMYEMTCNSFNEILPPKILLRLKRYEKHPIES